MWHRLDEKKSIEGDIHKFTETECRRSDVYGESILGCGPLFWNLHYLHGWLSGEL
jgi:hypothetical protein